MRSPLSFFVALALGAVSLSGTAYAAAGDEKAVLDAVAKFNAAAKSAKEADLKALLADDLTYVHSLGKVENKAECIAAIVKTPPHFAVQNTPVVKIHGTTAIYHARVTNNPGTPGAIPLDMMMVWVKMGKDWKLTSRHTARIPPGQ